MACGPNRVRLLCMLSLTFVYFIVEVVVSRVTASLSMLSDSFHMLSDVIALVVALVAVRFAEKTHSTNKNTFGWIRAEVMGALVNAVFLTALCFTIVLEAIERFTEPQEIENPVLVATAGAVGLLINLLGLCLFHDQTGGGHGHSHGGHGHSHGHKKEKALKKAGIGSSVDETNHLVRKQNSSGDVTTGNEISCKEEADVQMNGNTHYEEVESESDSAQLNMRGVFLHVLGDALGSVIVVINALIFMFVWQPCQAGDDCFNPCVHHHHDHMPNSTATTTTAGPCWVLYMDPTLCIIMVAILLYTTYPLLKESALILLQTVPKQINIHHLNDRLLRLDGVLAIHDLHIWQLAGSRIIATAHVKCHDPTSYMEVAKRIKDFFHNEGIHATTIQPEFVTFNSESRDSLCELSCRTQCAPKLCCGSVDKQSIASDKKASSDSRSGAASNLDVICETVEQAASIQVCPQPEAKVTVTKEAESSL